MSISPEAVALGSSIVLLLVVLDTLRKSIEKGVSMSNSKRRSIPWQEFLLVLLIVSVGAYLRYKFIFLMPTQPLLGYSADAVNYDVMARQLLDKGVYGYLSATPNAYVTPGYPLFLAMVYKLFGYQQGSPVQAVRAIQGLLSTLTIPIMYLIGRRVGNKRVGALAALMTAVYPSFAWAPTIILTEVLAVFFLMLSIYLFQIYWDGLSRWIGVLSGIVFGLSVLVRPSVAPLIVLPALLAILHRRRIDTVLLDFMWILAGFFLIMSPWWIRNWLTLHKVIWLATQTWNPMLGGAFPYDQRPSPLPPITDTGDVLKLIWSGFRSQPLLYLQWFTIGKFDRIFRTMWYAPPAGYQTLRSLVPLHSFIYTIGWLGVLQAVRRPRTQILAAMAFAVTAIQLMFIPENRYAFVIMPFLMILAAYVVDGALFSSHSKDQARNKLGAEAGEVIPSKAS